MNASVESSVAHANALATLQALVAENGPLATKIRGVLYHDSQYTSLGQSLLNRLQYLSRQFAAPGANVEPSQIMMSITASGIEQYEDAVLAACLIDAAWPGFQDQAFCERAIIAFRGEPVVYEELFGEFLPPWLAKRGRFNVAYQLYHKSHKVDFRFVDDAAAYRYKLDQRKTETPCVLGLSTGIRELDLATSGLTGLTLLGGAAGVGKTDLAIEICCTVLENQPEVAVMFVEFEMEKDRVLDRIVCNLAGVTEDEVLARELPMGRADDVMRGLDKLQELSPRLDVMELNAYETFDGSRFLERRSGFLKRNQCRRALVVMDYLQLIPLENPPGDSLEQDRQRLELLKSLRQRTTTGNSDADDAYLVISEVRKVDQDRDLVLEDLLGAGRSQFVGENVLLLQNCHDVVSTMESSATELIVAKTRRGRRTRIPLTFLYRRHAFQSAAAELPPAVADTLAVARLPRRRHV